MKLNLSLAAGKASEWFKEKFEAHLLTSAYKLSAKDACRDFFATYRMSSANFTDQAKQTIAKWGKDKVESDLAQICAANADVMVKALKSELDFLVPEQGEIGSDAKKVFEHALVLMQSQISDIENSQKGSSFDAAIESQIILAIFENPKTAAAKTLELLKIWSELKPSLKDILENAAKNILSFQTKAYLTLLDFDTALFKIFSNAGQTAFRKLQRELQAAMNKTSHEIRMEPSE